MALNAYLRIKGQKSGEIKGSSTQKGREGRIIVFAASHEVLSPRDPASGQATGKRQHKPFVITKEIDASSPRLYQLLVTNEIITEWELQFWAPGASGAEVQRYTVALKNASITDIHFTMANNRDPSLARLPEQEEVWFTYQKISWTWTQGSIAAEDDWLVKTA